MPENVEKTEVAASNKAPVTPAVGSKETDGRVDRIVQETRHLTDDLTEWVNLRVRLVQLDIQERLDQELDFVFSSVIVLGMIMIALFMASFGAAYVLGDLLGERWYGFGIIAVVYLAAALVISRVRPRLAGGFRSNWVRDRLDRTLKPSEKDQ